MSILSGHRMVTGHRMTPRIASKAARNLRETTTINPCVLLEHRWSRHTERRIAEA